MENIIPLNLPKVPESVNADLMTNAELWAAIQEGIDDVRNGRVQDASDAFSEFRECHR